MPQIDILSMDDLTTRFAELRDERESLAQEVEEKQDELNQLAEDEDGRSDAEDELALARKELQNFDENDGDELEKLTQLLDETRGYGGDHQFEGDWFPAQLIAESDFEDYAREFAEDIGAIPDDAQWPCTCIDWEKAARELQVDYSSVTYDGTDYLYR